MVFRGVPAEMADTLARVSQPFSVWSRSDAGLLAARDHLGVAPLFYARGGQDGWTIGTTVGEILDRLPGTRTRLDERSVVSHVAGPGAPDPAHTFYSRIRAVPRGALARFSPEAVDPRRYWDPAGIPPRDLDLGTAAAELRALVFEGVADSLPEGPVAIALSSGLGSATVLAALVEAGADVEAIAWTSTDVPESDEARWALCAARKLGVELTELPMDAEELLPESGVITRRSTPSFDKFDHMWRVTARTAAELGRHTLYTGFGGGHLFGGPIPAAADLLARLRVGQLSEQMSRIRESESSADGLMAQAISPLAAHLVPFLARRRHQPVPWLHESRKEMWQKRRRRTAGPGLLPARAERISRLMDGGIPQLVQDLVAQGTPHGIEMRHPLLDRRLVEFALSLPSWLLHDGQTDRLVLREAMRGVLPEEIVELDRVVPRELTLKALRGRGTQLLGLARNMRAADLGYVDEQVLFEEVASFLRGEHDDMRFWNTLTLEDWLRRWW